MRNTVDDRAIGLLEKVFMVNQASATDCWAMAGKVIGMCLSRHVKGHTAMDVERVRKMMVERLRKELSAPTFYDGMERCSVQTCIVVITREVTMNYVRNAHYWRSTTAELFLAMNVDVSGAEEHLRCLDERLTPSQKCVLRLLYGEGCTLAQAAGMLGVSQDEVRALQWQAMEVFHAEWLSLRLAGDAR